MKKQVFSLDLKKWEKWKRSLARIEKELRSLYFARGMFERLHSLYNSSQNLKKCPNDLFLIWSWNCYIVYLGMGIRRLVDVRSNAQNIYQLLEDIKDNVCPLTVDNYAEYILKKSHEGHIKNSQNVTKSEKEFLQESYRKDTRKRAITVFEEVLGGKAKILRCCDVEEDIKKIVEGPKKRKTGVEKYVNETWAHLDMIRPPAQKLSKVHEDLDLLITIYDKYSLLTGRGKFVKHDEKLFNEWDAPFRVPWTE